LGKYLREKGEGRREKGEGRREKGEERREKRIESPLDCIYSLALYAVSIKTSILSPRILNQLSIKINWEIRMITNSE
jgi:hypothetical protein